jgi:DNA-binding MarR family transcriptional regulator
VGTEAWAVLLRTHAAVVSRVEEQVERSTAMPLSWYDVLLELKAAPEGRLRMQELSDRVVLSRTRVSRLVDEMAARGLVVREPDPSDRRATYAVITAEGRRRQRQVAPTYLAAIEEHFSRHLTAPQLRSLRDNLRRLLDVHGR